MTEPLSPTRSFAVLAAQHADFSRVTGLFALIGNLPSPGDD